MISSIVREIQKWIAEHPGQQPSGMRVSQGVVDALVEESKWFGFTKDKNYKGSGLRIIGVPILVDPTMMIGKIDP